MKLNLKANNPAEERIKAYLEANASESLAKKINEGTPLVKDGKTLKNIKTLSGFMKYATEEARKTVKNGANYACIDDNTVYGWAVHYFEEEAIEGELFNADNTPYKAVITPKTEKPTPKPQPKAPAQKTAKILPTAKVAEPTQEPPKKNPTPTQEKPKGKEKLIFTQVKRKPTEPKKTNSTTYTVHEQLSLFDLF